MIDAPFSLTGSGTTAAIGAAANASLNLLIAAGYTNAVQFSCALPTNLTESACFVNPPSVSGGGPLALEVNTTPAHPSFSSVRPSGLFPTAAGVLSALLFPLFRRRHRFRMSLMMAVLFCAGLLVVIGCAGGPSGTDSGTLAGTYNVTVTATGVSGSTTYTSSISLPITVH